MKIEEIVKVRTGLSIREFAAQCADKVRAYSPRMLMQGLGEVLADDSSKNFVREHLIEETASALDLFAMYPLVSAAQ